MVFGLSILDFLLAALTRASDGEVHLSGNNPPTPPPPPPRVWRVPSASLPSKDLPTSLHRAIPMLPVPADAATLITSIAIPCLAVLVVDTALQRACHVAGLVNLHFIPKGEGDGQGMFFCAMVDAISYASYIAALVVLRVAVVQPSGILTADSWAEQTRRHASMRALVSCGFMIMVNMRLVTLAYRWLCWRSRGRDQFVVSRSIRSLLSAIALLGVVMIGVMVQVAGQLDAVREASVTERVTGLLRLIGSSDQEGLATLAEAADDFIDDGAHCYRTLRVARDDTGWSATRPEAELPGPGDLAEVFLGNARLVLVPVWCGRWFAMSAKKGIFAISDALAVLLVNLVGFSGIMTPIYSIMGSIINAARALDDDGMIVHKASGDASAREVSIEISCERVVRAVELLQKASLRGKAVVTRMLEEAHRDDNTEFAEGVAFLFGGVELQKRQANRPGHAAAKLWALPSKRRTRRRVDHHSVTAGGHSATERRALSVASRAASHLRVSRMGLSQGQSQGVGGLDVAKGTETGMGTLGFNALALSRDAMIATVVEMFAEMGLVVRKNSPGSVQGKDDCLTKKADAASLASNGASDGRNEVQPPTSGIKRGQVVPVTGRYASKPRADLEAVHLMVGRKVSLTGSLIRGEYTPGASKSPGSGLDQGVIDEITLVAFLEQVAERYVDHPYHSFAHAVDVTNTVFTLLHMSRGWVEEHLTALDVFCMLVAAVGHDIGHRGVSNGFLIETSDYMAITYNNRSVQESMHAATMIQLMTSDPDLNILQRLPADLQRTARNTIIDLILDTDMAFHFARTDDLEMLLSRREQAMKGPLGDSKMPRKDVLGIMNAFVHLADLGHALKHPALHAIWSGRVLQEFFSEAELVRELGMEPLPLMDPHKCVVPLSQMEYIDHVLLPYVTSFVSLLPELRPAALALKENYAFWADCLRLMREYSGQPGAPVQWPVAAEERVEPSAAAVAALQDTDLEPLVSWVCGLGLSTLPNKMWSMDLDQAVAQVSAKLDHVLVVSMRDIADHFDV